jgi:sucrose-6-phosphate hydrolase SacC (GH32 family)
MPCIGTAADISPEEAAAWRSILERSRAPAETIAASRSLRLAIIAHSPHHPIYHLVTHEGWGDPFGLVTYDGFYRLFPYGPASSKWQHFVSRDLVRWQQWPVALTDPDADGDSHMSGSLFVTDDGRLNAIMSMNRSKKKLPCTYKRYVSDDAFLTATGHTIFDTAGALATGIHDCRVWRQDGHWFLLAAGHPLTIWSSPDLQQWTCRGPAMPSTVVEGTGEVGDYQGLGAAGILSLLQATPNPFGSGHRKGRANLYWLGHFDAGSAVFTPQQTTPLVLDGGHAHAYKISTLTDPADNTARRVVGIAAMRHKTSGERSDPLRWQSPLTLARELSLRDGVLWQEPVAELVQLRSELLIEADQASVATLNQRLATLRSDTCEISLRLPAATTGRVGVAVRISDDGLDALHALVDADSRRILVDGPTKQRNDADPAVNSHIFWPLQTATAIHSDPALPLSVRVFVDRCAVEIYVNGAVHSALTFPRGEAKGIQLIASDPNQSVEQLRIWEMATIWM